MRGSSGWCERNRVAYVFGLAGNKVLLARVIDLAEEAAVSRVRAKNLIRPSRPMRMRAGPLPCRFPKT